MRMWISWTNSFCFARVAQQCLYENCLQMIEKEQWPSNNSLNLNTREISCLGTTHAAILKSSSKAPNSFWIIKSRSWEDVGKFSTGPMNKAVPSFGNGRSMWRVTENILSIFLFSKVFTFTAFALSWTVETIDWEFVTYVFKIRKNSYYHITTNCKVSEFAQH